MNMNEAERIINGLIKIDETQLQQQLLEHAANYAWFSVLDAKAQNKREQLRFDLKVLEAELDRRIRESALTEGKKVTEKEIEMRIVSDPEYKQKMREYLEAKEEEDVLGAIVQAFNHRKDMLVSYVSLQKEELKAGISIKGV